jgi:hypothetical protein
VPDIAYEPQYDRTTIRTLNGLGHWDPVCDETGQPIDVGARGRRRRAEHQLEVQRMYVALMRMELPPWH